MSHLFLADDLLLVGEASYSQACVMEHIISQFCAVFEQWVNRRKSMIWFSPKVPAYLRHTICSSFEITATSDLGIYLGVPLLHNRTRKSTFQYLMEKVRGKLKGWKENTLSRTAKALLIQISLMSILVYLMQTMRLLVGIINEMERVC